MLGFQNEKGKTVIKEKESTLYVRLCVRWYVRLYVIHYYTNSNTLSIAGQNSLLNQFQYSVHCRGAFSRKLCPIQAHTPGLPSIVTVYVNTQNKTKKRNKENSQVSHFQSSS